MILLIAVTTLAMLPICRNEFIEWDDPQTIQANPNFNPPTFQGLLNHWTSPHQALYVPVTYTVWWMIAQVAGTASADGTSLNPWIYHSASLLIHLASTLLVLFLVRRLTGSSVGALVGAMVFGVHSTQVEAVAWASGTKDVLGGALSLAAILLFHRAGDNRRKHAIAIVVWIIAFLAKPSAVVVPGMIVVVQWLWFHDDWKHVLRRTWPWLVATIPAILFTAWIQPTIHSQTTAIWWRPLVAADAIAFYLVKLIAPVHLALDYGRTPASIIANGQILWTWILPGIILIGLLIARERRAFAIALLFLIALSPVLGLVNFTFQSYSTVADHYLYLPMFAAALLIAEIIRVRPKLTPFFAMLLVFLAIQTFNKSRTWRDTRTVFNHVLSVNSRSSLACTTLAVVSIRERDDGTAKALLLRAIKFNPDYGPARLNLATLYLRQNEKALAKNEFDELLRIYKSQRNADPKLLAQVNALVEKLTGH